MSDNSAFHQLTSQLSQGERNELLQKIRRSVSFSSEPFLRQQEVSQPIDFETEYEQLGLIPRLIIFLKCLFSSRERNEITEEYLVKRLVQGIQREHPNLIDISGKAALSNLYRELESLENVASVFLTPLETALEGTKQEFIMFLASFEMEVLHGRLEEAVNPFGDLENFQDKENEEIKKQLEFRLEDLMMDVTESQRKTIGRQLFLLEQLRQLCLFPFKKVLSRFSRREGDGQMVCALEKLKEQLLKLEQILYALREPPETATIEALFLYLYRKEVSNNEGDAEEKITRQLERTKLAMQRLRQFHRNVPIIDVMKFTLGDLNHFPKAGHEQTDWFILYKEYWHSVLEKHYNTFVGERKKKQIITDATDFLQEAVFPQLHHYRDGTHSLLFHPRYQYTLAFLYHYVRKYLGQVFSRELQAILIDGEFYKDQNRRDFTDSYNTLFQIEKRVQFVEDSLSAEESLGKRIIAVDKEILTKQLKKKKMESVVEMMERENSQILRSCMNSLQGFYNVINGILYGEVGGRYDTLSNLSYLGGSDNKGFKKKLDMLINNLSEAKQHLNQLSTIEGW